MNTAEVNSVSLNGVEYVRKDSVKDVPHSGRYVFVLDRGWIFAGDLRVPPGTGTTGRVELARVVLVQSWSGVGFDGMIENPKKSCVLKPISTSVDFPEDAELFRLPVKADWGL